MHTLICGVTQSGKTTMAHLLAKYLGEKGIGIVVLDPVGTSTAAGTWPESAVVFHDEQEFWEYMDNPEVINCQVFIDEAGDFFNISRRENFWLLTRGRHFGIFVTLICQRPKMIAPTVRNQCSKAYVFRLASDDLKEIGEDFGFSGLKNETLDRGDCLVLESGTSQFSRTNVFNLTPD